MTQTFEQPLSFEPTHDTPNQRTAAALSSLALDRTAASIDEFLPILDGTKLHRKITADIDRVSGCNGPVSPQESKILRQSIADNALDLAARILPEDVRSTYNLSALIRDNDGVDHPPTKQEVILLGTSWDITRSSNNLDKEATLLGNCVVASIEELPEEVERKLLQRVLRKSHQDSAGFTTTYVHEEADRLAVTKSFNPDNSFEPVTYLARSNGSATRLDSLSPNPLDEENERLVSVVPTHFAPEGDTLVHGMPLIHFQK